MYLRFLPKHNRSIRFLAKFFFFSIRNSRHTAIRNRYKYRWKVKRVLVITSWKIGNNENQFDETRMTNNNI